MYQRYAQEVTTEANRVINIKREIGSIVVNLFRDDKEGMGRKQVREQSKRIEEGQRQARIITFAYREEGKPKDAALEEASYVVYMTGKMGDTVTPVGTCAMTGLEYLNYSDLSGRPEKDRDKINASVVRFAEGLARILGTVDYAAVLKDIAQDMDGLLKLVKSGIIFITIRPIDTQKIVDFYRREAEVLRAL